jgi:hypothetical protein
MRKFAPLDDALIERVFQPASDFISLQIGMARSATTCLCIDAASLAWIVSRTRGLSETVTAWNFGDALLDPTLLMLGLGALISLRMLFRRPTTNKRANPLRPAMQPHRAVVLLMLASRLAQLHAPGLADAADLAMLLCAASALYLGACAERPPFHREWATLAPSGA